MARRRAGEIRQMVKWGGCCTVSFGTAGAWRSAWGRACCHHLVVGDSGTEHSGLVAPRQGFVWLCDTSTRVRLALRHFDACSFGLAAPRHTAAWPCGTRARVRLALRHPGTQKSGLAAPRSASSVLAAPRHTVAWHCGTRARARLALRHPGRCSIGLVEPGRAYVWPSSGRG